MVHVLLASIAQMKSDDIRWDEAIHEPGFECCQDVAMLQICLREIHATLELHFILTTMI